ncbi:hypothetical protein NPS53_08545 [Pseudomonas putida]|uniref:hypothetical protein n=1 Tax=Pseudomonas putida TaxID=303 RepID=UPI0023646A5B|nr:hypothetical protein [Pseudomonas putida]MDD2139621.1 hypothetical protein [Pseudomonas putida]HDS1721544.1 hypothetical protein [Pseudomonas putida]
MAYNEFSMCSRHAERQVQFRRQMEQDSVFARGTALVAAMLAEGDLIDKALEPLKLDHLEKMNYVANNSVYIKSKDGHEAIQIVWADAQLVCIHRLLSKELRSEFQAQWLGVWAEPVQGRSRKAFIKEIRLRVSHREAMRVAVGLHQEIPFAASPATVLPNYELRA